MKAYMTDTSISINDAWPTAVVQGHSKWCRSIDYTRLTYWSAIHCKLTIDPSCAIFELYIYMTLNNVLALKSRLDLEVSQGWKRHHSISHTSSFVFHCNYGRILYLIWTHHSHGTGPDRTYHPSRFIFSWFFYNFLFVPCGGPSWLQVTTAGYCTLNTQYRIVSHFRNNILVEKRQIFISPSI